MSPGARRNAGPASVRSRSHEPFNQSEPAEGRIRSPLCTFYEPPICVPTRFPTGVTRTSWRLPLYGNNSRTNRAQLWENVGALNPEFAYAGTAGTTRGPVAQNATTVFGRQRISSLSLASEKFDGQLFPWNTQAIAGYHFIEGEAFPRRTPAAAAGSAGNGSTKTICFYRSPVRAILAPLTQRTVIDLNILARMTMMPLVL